jgi:diaminohydroxyphosphoribosylaminopyrimidine deaminase / 5-amino-6-(5-phosphoribosylamino)uracil reductase
VDNPSLTCRSKKGRNPVRVIIDSQLKTSPGSKVYGNDGTGVILAVSEKVDKIKSEIYPNYIEILRCPLNQDGKINLEFLTQKLYEKGIFSILVEAGGTLNGAFLKYNLIDKIYFFIAPKILGDNFAKSSFEGFKIENINDSRKFDFGEIKFFPPDIMIEGYFE